MTALKKYCRRLALFLLVVFVVLQFFRPEKNLSAASPNDLFALHPAPPEIKQLLAIACYDCHSNNTRYPWYAEIQPMGWWLAQHVRDGKRALNFSTFGTLTPRRAKNALEASMDQIETRTMPLPSYLIAHSDAKLSDDQIGALTAWFEETVERIDEASE